MMSDITLETKPICLAIILLIGCSPEIELSQSVDGENSVNSNFSAYATNNSVSRQENVGPNNYHSFQTKMEHFIDIRFERQQEGDWHCREVKGELLSPEFLENLIGMLHPHVVLEQSVALPICVRMHFSEDFPFLLRQAVIALVLPCCNIGVESAIEFGSGILTSDLAIALSQHDSEKSLLEHVEKIRKEYTVLLKKGSVVIHLLEDGERQMIEKSNFNISSNKEFLLVVNKMHEMKKSEKRIFLAWEWGNLKYFEYICPE